MLMHGLIELKSTVTMLLSRISIEFSNRKSKSIDFRPVKARAVRRFIPMMWIDQTITLNENVFNRLKGVSGILQKGHNAHQSLKLVYVLIAFLSIIAVITAIELFLWNRQVRDLH